MKKESQPGNGGFNSINKLYTFVFLGIFILLFFAFAITEIGLRAKTRYMGSPLGSYHSPYDMEGWHEYIFRRTENIDSFRDLTREFTHVRSTNDIGFTDSRSVCELRDYANKLRILALGDSFTEGYGADTRESWPQVLEQNLRENGNQNCLVYNSGISGNDPFFEFQNLRFLYPKVQPQIVIMLINSGDLDNVHLRGQWDRFREDGQVLFKKMPPWWESLYEKSYVVRVLVRDVCKYNHLLTHETYENIYRQASLEIIEALDSCKKFTAIQGGTFLLVYHPLADNGVTSKDTELIFFTQLLKERYAPYFLDLTPAIKKGPREEYFWKYDRHCTPKGYRVLAEGIEEYLNEHILSSKNQ